MVDNNNDIIYTVKKY